MYHFAHCYFVLKNSFHFFQLNRENVLAMLQAGQRVADNPVYLSDLGKCIYMYYLAVFNGLFLDIWRIDSTITCLQSI